jgi:hypothetical protein
MADPYVRAIGHIEDIDGRIETIGVDYDTVTVAGLRLNRAEAEVFAAFFVAAAWEAGANAKRMRQEQADG